MFARYFIAYSEQLRTATSYKVGLEDTIVELRQQLEECQLKIALEEVRRREDDLEERFKKLQLKYDNCREENAVIKKLIKEKDEAIAYLTN